MGSQAQGRLQQDRDTFGPSVDVMAELVERRIEEEGREELPDLLVVGRQERQARRAIEVCREKGRRGPYVMRIHSAKRAVRIVRPRLSTQG